MERVTDSGEIARLERLFAQQIEGDDASIFASSVGQVQNIRVVTLDLTTAKLSTTPLDLGFPFRSLYVVSTTDSTVSVNMRLESTDSINDSFPLKAQTSIKLPFPVRRAFLDWSAQSGKTIQILFALRGEFSTNQVAAISSGGISIYDGDSVTSGSVGSVTTTAAALIAADSSRKKAIIQNQGAVSIYIGGSTVTAVSGARPGIEIPPGGTFEWSSTGACYAITSSVTNSNISVTSFS